MNNYQLPLNFLIADHHRMMVDGLLLILKTEINTGEIFTACDGQAAVQKSLEHPVDCVLMESDMPLLNGVEATKQIKDQKPHVKVIVISLFCEALLVTNTMKAGADAFIVKKCGREELKKAIEKVMNDEKYISPGLACNLYSMVNNRAACNGNETQLTPREVEIIRYIAEGYTNQEIAAKLYLSHRTVDTHRKNMIGKLGLKNTAMLVKYAAGKGLL